MRRFAWPAVFIDDRQSLAESHQQTKRVHGGEVLRGLVPLGNELFRVFCWTEGWVQLIERVVVETKIAGGNPLLQNRGAGEQGHRSPLHHIGRREQNFPVTFKKCPCHLSFYILGEG